MASNATIEYAFDFMISKKDIIILSIEHNIIEEWDIDDIK